MFRRNIYYTLKPFLPLRLRRAVRAWFVRRKLKDPRVQAVWPILESAGEKPAGWPGWPDGKQFAFVLTHDVEGPDGLAKVHPLAELEMSLGFRSCFNFIPEGDYTVPPELRTWLLENGFEVGVHDLYHDGHLFRNRRAFAGNAIRINRYLREWGAAGFRSGFMLRRAEWLHDLDIEYDLSTFDTDPFEPQPDGVGTIFPFFVSKDEKGKDGPQTTHHRPQTSFDGRVAPEVSSPVVSGPVVSREARAPSPLPLTPLPQGEAAVSGPVAPHDASAPTGQPPPAAQVPWSLGPLVSGPPAPRAGYVELPYTLPQDSTLFLLLGEKTQELWQRKIDWIARKGGMALVNVHPDYMSFDRQNDPTSYPVDRYRDLLESVTADHGGRFWHVLPRELAVFVRAHAFRSDA